MLNDPLDLFCLFPGVLASQSTFSIRPQITAPLLAWPLSAKSSNQDTSSIMNSSHGTPSSGLSPRLGEENMSMYFDFGAPSHQDIQNSFQSLPSSSTTSQDGQESGPRAGGIRVSLACIPVSTPINPETISRLNHRSVEVAM